MSPQRSGSRTLLVAALCVVAPLLSPAAAEPERVDAAVERLSLRLRRKAHADRCVIRMRLPLDPYLDTLDVRAAAIAVDVGAVRVLDLTEPGAAARLREKKPLLWRGKVRGTTGRRGARFVLDLARHSVSVTVPRIDLDTVADVANEGVRVSVTLGERVYEQVVDVRGTARRLLLAERPPVVGGPDDGSEGGDESGGPTIDPIVLELNWSSGVAAARNVVVRSESEFAALWAEHQSWVSPPAARPAVDFATQMVVAVFLGDRPSPAHSIELRRVGSGGGTTTVDYTDARITSGNCLFPAVMTQPTLFVAVPRTDVVSFRGRIEQRSCP